MEPYCNGMLVADADEEKGRIAYLTTNVIRPKNVLQAYIKRPIDIVYNASPLVDEDHYLVLQAPEKVEKEDENKDEPKIGALVKVNKDSFRAPCTN